MRAVEFNLKDPEFGAELIEVDEPDLPNGEWARVAVTVGGICGSDLHLFGGPGLRAPALGGFWTFPFLLGHEIAGTVVEAGAGCDIPIGTRVAIDPAIPCAARGISPVCRMCASGHASCCFELGNRVMTPGMSIGYTVGLGGGWADQVLAHRSMLHRIPDAVPDSIASLHEPVSIGVHGLLRKPPRNGDPVIVVGAGIIGLAAVAARAQSLSRLRDHHDRAPRAPSRGRAFGRAPRRDDRGSLRALRGLGRDRGRRRDRPRVAAGCCSVVSRT